MFRGSVKVLATHSIRQLVMLDTPCSEVVWKVLATHSIRQLVMQDTPCSGVVWRILATHSIRQLVMLDTPCSVVVWRVLATHSIRQLVMLDKPCYEVVWRVLATHSIRQFPLHFPSRTSPCAITFQLDSTYVYASLSNNFIAPGTKQCPRIWQHFIVASSESAWAPFWSTQTGVSNINFISFPLWNIIREVYWYCVSLSFNLQNVFATLAKPATAAAQTTAVANGTCL